MSIFTAIMPIVLNGWLFSLYAEDIHKLPKNNKSQNMMLDEKELNHLIFNNRLKRYKKLNKDFKNDKYSTTR